MKKIYSLLKKNAFIIAFLILSCTSNTTKGQYWMEKYGHLENFYEISDSTEWWFNQDTSRISNSVFGYKSFARWKTFLSSRVDESGTLRTYAIEYAKAVEEIRNRSLTSIGNEWESLGPIENSYHVSPETAYLGIVTGMKVID